MSNEVSVSMRRAGNAVDRRTIRRRAVKILEALGFQSAELSIVLCDDTFIHELNRDYRHKDKPTDVLSFPMCEPDELEGEESPMLGDVIISVPTAAKQARSLKHSLLAEVTSLLVHGILHLVGHDHLSPRDESAMQEAAGVLEQLFKSS